MPVLDNKEIVGTLSINKIYNGDVAFSEDAGVLSICGAIIAQAVRIRQEYLEEILQLREANKKLYVEIREGCGHRIWSETQVKCAICSI